MRSDHKEQKNGDLTPADQPAAGFSRQFAMAMELPYVIVSAIAVGGLIGFFLDRWLLHRRAPQFSALPQEIHTKPYLMLALAFLGFFGGPREVLRRLNKQ